MTPNNRYRYGFDPVTMCADISNVTFYLCIGKDSRHRLSAVHEFGPNDAHNDAGTNRSFHEPSSRYVAVSVSCPLSGAVRMA